MLKKIFILIKIVVAIHLLFSLINCEWTAIFVCLLNLILLLLADFVKNKICYNNLLHVLIYIFLTCSLLGGEVYYLYTRISFFDVVMHVLSSFIASALAFYIIKLFKININKFLLMTFIFSFAMMVAALWEITEFSIDRLFKIDMQKDTVISEVNSVLLSSDGESVVRKEIKKMKIGEYTVDGYLDIGLYDTIEDMICAVFGSILFILMYKMKEVLLL